MILFNAVRVPTRLVAPGNNSRTLALLRVPHGSSALAPFPHLMGGGAGLQGPFWLLHQADLLRPPAEAGIRRCTLPPRLAARSHCSPLCFRT